MNSHNMKARVVTFAAAFGLCALAPQVQAADREWTAVASTCTPDEDSSGKYEFDFGRARFRGASSGDIGFRCNVTDPGDSSIHTNPSWARMDVTYDDPDGFFSNYQVYVELRRVHEVTGDSFLVATSIATRFPLGNSCKPRSSAIPSISTTTPIT